MSLAISLQREQNGSTGYCRQRRNLSRTKCYISTCNFPKVIRNKQQRKEPACAAQMSKYLFLFYVFSVPVWFCFAGMKLFILIILLYFLSSIVMPPLLFLILAIWVSSVFLHSLPQDCQFVDFYKDVTFDLIYFNCFSCFISFIFPLSFIIFFLCFFWV